MFCICATNVLLKFNWPVGCLTRYQVCLLYVSMSVSSVECHHEKRISCNSCHSAENFKYYPCDDGINALVSTPALLLFITSANARDHVITARLRFMALHV